MKPRSAFVSNLRMVGLAAVIGLLVPSTSTEYEFSTHAAMTREAYLRWTVNNGQGVALDRIGLTGKQDSLGSVYIDLGRGSQDVTERLASPPGPGNTGSFAQDHIDAANRNSASQPSMESIAGWLMQGAIREDDVPFDKDALENTPQDEPQGSFIRVRNHFYDPYFDRALSFAGEVGAKAPDWAIAGANGSGEHQNHFAVVDAREAMWRALTLRKYPTPASGALEDVSLIPSLNVHTREELRLAYWATTFRALGGSVHLLQDMAQPQHTRNDSHAGLGCLAGACALGHASYYESYVDARASGAQSFRLRERFFESSDPNDVDEPLAKPVLDYAGVPQYEIVKFSKYRDYFSTATAQASLNGFGLANYSNRGFYSAGTNIGNTASYLQPPLLVTDASLGQLVLQDGTVRNANGGLIPGKLTLVKGQVRDSIHPDREDGQSVALSSRGAFDQFVAPARAGKGQYTLNHYNYDDQARLLIPRAVAYSAGLIDYFFRGKMEIALPDEGVYGILDHSRFVPPEPQTNALLDFKGFNRIKIRLKNTTDDIMPPQREALKQTMSAGTLVAVLKFRRNLCYVDTLDNEITDPSQANACRNAIEEIVVSDPLTGQSVPFGDDMQPSGLELAFTFQQELPINAWDVVLQVVYRGALGSETDAVAVVSKDISEPTFVSIFNDTDYVYLGGTCYQPETIAGNSTLWNSLAPVCIDTTSRSRKVSDVCVKVPLNIAYRFGSATRSVLAAMKLEGAHDTRLLQRRFGRIALLGDAAASVPYTLEFQDAPLSLAGGGSTAQKSLGTYTVQKEAQVAGTYDNHRGVKLWNASVFAVDGATASVAGACAAPNNDLLKDAERYPSALTIVGWD